MMSPCKTLLALFEDKKAAPCATNQKKKLIKYIRKKKKKEQKTTPVIRKVRFSVLQLIDQPCHL